MMIVTGAAGFIGCNLLKDLNEKGCTNITAVDDLTDGKKFAHLANAQIADYLDYEDFLEMILEDEHFEEPIEAIFHQGACSTTTEWNGRYMMANNYEYSKVLLHYCLARKIPFIYASSAAVYGGSDTFKEELKYEKPLNVYGYSKYLFDQYVRQLLSEAKSQIVGLRYFNVYGPQEDHKGSMASVAWHLMNQLKKGNTITLFEGYDGYGEGEQKRDFVFVEDAVKVNLWFLTHPDKSGIFNCGTGEAREFNVIAKTVLKLHGKGKLEYIPFPEHLKGAYQSFTQADMSNLRKIGYQEKFTSLEEGVKKYYQWYMSQ